MKSHTLLYRLMRIPSSISPRSRHTMYARTYEEGLAAYKAGRYDEALASLRPYAERGDALAQLTLGNIYRKGLGVTKDVDEAAHWYHKAAAQGDPDAQFNLGIMYISGDGVTLDEVEAVNWFEHAAEQGHRQARLACEHVVREGYQDVC